jgi:hypothetical protein
MSGEMGGDMKCNSERTTQKCREESKLNGINDKEGRGGRKKGGGHKNITIPSLLKGVANN